MKQSARIVCAWQPGRANWRARSAFPSPSEIWWNRPRLSITFPRFWWTIRPGGGYWPRCIWKRGASGHSSPTRCEPFWRLCGDGVPSPIPPWGRSWPCSKSATTSISIFESEPLFDAGAEDQCTNSSVEAMMTYLQVTSRADVSRVIDRLAGVPSRRSGGGAAGCECRCGAARNGGSGVARSGAGRTADSNRELGLLQSAAAYWNRFARGLLYRYRDRTARVAGRRHPRQLLVPASAPALEPQPGGGADRRTGRHAIVGQESILRKLFWPA